MTPSSKRTLSEQDSMVTVIVKTGLHFDPDRDIWPTECITVPKSDFAVDEGGVRVTVTRPNGDRIDRHFRWSGVIEWQHPEEFARW